MQCNAMQHNAQQSNVLQSWKLPTLERKTMLLGKIAYMHQEMVG